MEPSRSQKRIVPRLPDFFGFAYLKGGRSERQCGQSTAAMRTGSAQNGQSLMPLAGITIPTVCLGRNISKPATEAKGQTIITGVTTIAFAPSSNYQHSAWGLLALEQRQSRNVDHAGFSSSNVAPCVLSTRNVWRAIISSSSVIRPFSTS